MFFFPTVIIYQGVSMSLAVKDRLLLSKSQNLPFLDMVFGFRFRLVEIIHNVLKLLAINIFYTKLITSFFFRGKGFSSK